MRHRLLIPGFSVMLLASIGGMLWTSDWFMPLAVRYEQRPSAASFVDQRPPQNARKVASLAALPEEQSLAQEALQAAD